MMLRRVISLGFMDLLIKVYFGFCVGLRSEPVLEFGEDEEVLARREALVVVIPFFEFYLVL